MCPRPQYTDLPYMGGTGSCGPIKIIFVGVIKSWYTSLNIKFDANRTFHVPKSPIYLFGLYGKYQILWTDIVHLQSLRPNAIVITTDGRADRQV